MGREDPLEKEMAMHSSILAREIPWTEEPGGLQSMDSENGHDLVTKQQNNRYVRPTDQETADIKDSV